MFHPIGIILLIFAVAALAMAIIVLVKDTNSSRRRLILAVLCTSLAIYLVGSAVTAGEMYSRFPHLLRISEPFILILPVMMYAYVKDGIGGGLQRADAFHALPFAVYVVWLIPFYMSSGFDKVRLHDLHIDGSLSTTGGIIILVVKLVVIGGYTVATLRISEDWQQKIRKRASNPVLLQHWLPQTMRVMMWSLVTATLFATLLAAGFLDFLLYDWLTTLAIGSALFFFTWNAVVHIDDSILDHVFGVRNASQSTSEGWPDLIVDCDITCTPADEAFRWINPALPIITEEEMLQQRWYQKLDETMTEQYWWKETELSSELVANRIGLSETLVQKLIENQSRCSFFDYVNRKRVTEIKRNLAQRRNSAIDYNQLAIDCGFQNQKAMNRVFVRETGTSPKTFRRLSS